MSQVRVSGNASGTGILTVTSPNTNSNYTLTLPTAAGNIVGTGDSATVTQTMLDTSVIPLGAGQTWTDVTASRAYGTTYTNSTGRPICMTCYVGVPNSTNPTYISVGGTAVSWAQGPGSGSYGYWVSAIIPSGSTYSLVQGGGNGITKWIELR